ncbi:hypothetical protein [Streptomyces sp. NBC_01314]|uniref:hypothetical protein n=1 Tax=Streptomyces sp. NBC_01314 TaxID=2903821 RepID=UPI003085AD2E|nr:hypothetical protein OG622_02685 [Streptomyces sp. NBC_01314]
MEWMAFQGRHDETDTQSLVLMVDDAAHANHLPQLHARAEQFACINPTALQ